VKTLKESIQTEEWIMKINGQTTERTARQLVYCREDKPRPKIYFGSRPSANRDEINQKEEK